MPRVSVVKGEAEASPIRPFLAIASYGDIPPAFVTSLWASQIALHAAGMPTTLEIFSENCHVDDSRNMLVRDFLETDCTDLVFLDSDITWEAHKIVELLRVDRDIVAGIYPLKQLGKRDFPVNIAPGTILQAEADGCVEVLGVPTGFLRIRRKVLEELERSAPKFKGQNEPPERRALPLIFERTFEDGVRYGGDYVFCARARKKGFKVYVLPEMHFGHIGKYEWEGHLGQHWRKEHGVAQARYDAGFALLRQGKVGEVDFSAICEHWGNVPWAAGEALVVSWALTIAENPGPILECGAGLTSLIAAAINASGLVIALEHDEEWAARIRKEARRFGLANLLVVEAPLEDGWYRLPKVFPRDFSLILVDGPPRDKGNRDLFAKQGFNAGAVFFDDLDRKAVRDWVEEFASEHGYFAHVVEDPSKNFAICKRVGELKVSAA